MGYFNFRNKKVYYEEFGEGKPLLLLHGNTASSRMFEDAAGRYAEHFKVILIDFLGHGKSERLDKFPADLWHWEAEQVITFLRESELEDANLIGSSGGALVAINVALEAPELVGKVIADSFEGEAPLKIVVESIREDREASKHDESSRMFYSHMHGSDWEQVVDNDTDAAIRHERELGRFFHKPLQSLRPEILLTGSQQDKFVSLLSPTYFEDVYGDMITKIGHGSMHLLESGGHPAMLTSPDAFYSLSMAFFNRRIGA